MFSFFLVLFLNGGHFTIFDRIYIVGWVHKNPGLIVSYHIQNIFILYENKSHKIITNITTRNVCITKYARLYKLSNDIMVIQSNN